MITKQLLFVESSEPSNQSTIEKLHAEAVMLHSNETVRLSITEEGTNVLDVYGHVLADKIRGRSDARLKSDIRDMDSEVSLDVVRRLCGKTYMHNSIQSYGLIAQDVEMIIPEVVSKDTLGYLNVSYLELIPFLIEAIKGLERKVASLSNK